MRWDECAGAVSTFEQPYRNQNGHTVDREGRLVACEHRGRCVSRIEHDGTRTVLADRFEGMRLNSPNDVVVKADGSIWFTDPSYGIDSEYEGDAAESEIGASNVYRIDPDDGAVTLVIDDLVQPNGIAFSPDEVAALRHRHRPQPPPDHEPRRSAPTRSRSTARPSHDGHDFASARRAPSTASASTPAATSGARPATASTASPRTAPCSARSSSPRSCANVAFGGRKRNRLFICATTSVFAHYVNARGCGF